MNVRCTLLAFLSIFFFGSASAQLGEYSFSQSFISYTGLTTANIPTDTVGATPLYLRRNYQLALPFNFTLGSITEDSIWVDFAGFCALKRNNAPAQNTTLYDRALSQMPYYEGVIAPQAEFFGTIASNPLLTGIRTDVTGTAPNRVFTIEWRNFKATNRNMQVKLHETSNVIDFCYSMSYIVSMTAEVGLRTNDTTVFTGKTIGRTNLYINPSTNIRRNSRWDSTRAMLNTTEKMVSDYPPANIPVGLQYTWTPPVSCFNSATGLQLPDSFVICAGQTVLLTPTGLSSGLNYQWQTSTNGTNWSNVTSGQGGQNFQYRSPAKRDTADVWYRLQATCTINQQAIYSNAVKVKSTHEQAPYFEGFENIGASDNLPTCLTTAPKTQVGGYNWRTVYNTAAFSGIGKITNYTMNSEWLYTPGIYLEAGKQYRFSHMYLLNFYPLPNDSIKIGIGTLPTADSITNIAVGGTDSLSYYGSSFPALTTKEKYRRMEVYFTVPASGIYFGGIRRSAANYGGADVDNIELMEVPAIDAMVDSVLSPSFYTTSCYLPQMEVTVRVKNAGTQSISNIPMYYKLGNTTIGPEVISQSIPAGGAIQYTFNQQANVPGIYTNYKIQAWAGLPGDSYVRNDSSYVMAFLTDTIKPVPYIQNFEGGSGNTTPLSSFKWYGNSSVSAVSSTINSTRMLRINFGNIPANGRDSIASATIGPIAANSFLRFKYRMANLTGNTSAMQAGDTVYVLGRVNCGIADDTLMKIHAGMQTTSGTLQYAMNTSLGQFTGGNLKLSLVSRKTSTVSNFYIDIDSFQVVNLTTTDMTVNGVTKIASVACVGDNVPVRVALRNMGALPATGFPVKVQINGQPSSLAYSYPGSLGYNQDDTVDIGFINFSSAGTYDLKIYSEQQQDVNGVNDTIYRRVYAINPPVAPAAIDTQMCNASNLTINNANNSVAFWFTDNLPTTNFFQTGNELTNIVTSDTLFVKNRGYVPMTAGPTDKNPNWSSGFSSTGYGLAFDAHSDCILDSVGVYPSGTGSITVEIVSCVTCAQPMVISTHTFNFVNASGAKQMVSLNQYIPAGGNYAIRLQSISGLSGLIRDFPFTGFPLSTPESPVTIAYSKTPTAPSYDFYYYFYDWKIKALSSCVSSGSMIAIRQGTTPVTSFNTTVSGNNLNLTNTSHGGGTYFWDFGDSNTSNLVSPAHTYSADGTYQVKLLQTNACGTDTAAQTIVINTTSMNSIQQGLPSLTVYPNPASDEVNISFNSDESGPASVVIVDMNGRTLTRATGNVKKGPNLLQHDVSHLAPGIYWIVVHIEKKEARAKFSVIK